MNGIISWFTKNSVAANLLMVTIFFLGGYTLLNNVTLEVFPDFESNIINISVPYRGATPVEVEEGVVIRIEEAIHDLVGIETLSSTSSEGSARVSVEVMERYNPRDMLDDIKNRVDAINTFPDEIERPVYNIVQRKHEVINVVVSADLPEHELRQLGEQVRSDIINLPGITQAELTAVRSYEVSIEVSEHTLKKYNLTFDMVSRAIKNSSLDLPAGVIKTTGGEILLRTKGQAYLKEDFKKIVISTQKNGTGLTLADISTISNGFEEEPLFARFNNRPSVLIEVYRVGSQNAIDIADKTIKYINSVSMPQGVELHYWHNRSIIIKNRLKTLLKSAVQGGILVFILLTLFLRFNVAVWVCLGIPISFMGAIFMMPVLGVTINIITLFAFILVLGIVVDDAIVVGENIYTHRKKSEDSTFAAIRGAQEVSIPVIFGVLTTVAAFVPLLLIGGRRGAIFSQIPKVVIPVLIFSLMESKLVLPAHLKHMKMGSGNILLRVQDKVSEGLEYFIAHAYRPSLALTAKYRYVTVSIFLSVLIIILSIVKSGYLHFAFFPKVQSEFARATLVMPEGTPFEITSAHVQRISDAALELKEKYFNKETQKGIIKNILMMSGSTGYGSPKSHIGRVSFEIVPPELREDRITSSELVREWRKIIGSLEGAKELNFRAEIGRTSSPIDIQLAGHDFKILQKIAQQVKTKLSEYSAVFDIADTFEDGKEEIQLDIKPEAEYLGLSRMDLARQVRQAFFGEQVQRIQRGQEDVRVMLRYPKNERKSINDLKTMNIRTANGDEVPFEHVANIKMGRGFSAIKHVERKRTINITADINKETINMASVSTDLKKFLDKITGGHAGVSYSFEGEAKEQKKSFRGLIYGMLFVLFAIYALLAVPLKSYFQPLIVMSVIPFGLIGAIIGHIIVNINLNILSLFGILALTGVVVNDSLVLVDYINKQTQEGLTLREAVQTSGEARFRAILLTSLTTFAGLMPLIFEKSTQAQFLIPMAVSLGFGVLFATFVTLYLIPVTYIILDDFMSLLRQKNQT